MKLRVCLFPELHIFPATINTLATSDGSQLLKQEYFPHATYSGIPVHSEIDGPEIWDWQASSFFLEN